MSYSPTFILLPNSPPTNPVPSLRFTTPEAPSQPQFIHHYPPISRLASLVFQSPTTPDSWALSSSEPDSITSGTSSDTRSTSMEGGGDDDNKGTSKGKSRQSTPSASSSQGDMADNEAETGQSQAGEQANPPPPPKKKRTRTLTTPHQAAVLHALLAQVRTLTCQNDSSRLT